MSSYLLDPFAPPSSIDHLLPPRDMESEYKHVLEVCDLARKCNLKLLPDLLEIEKKCWLKLKGKV